MNSTINSAGRFGNHFFRNMVAHIISLSNNIKFIYSYYEEFKKLGIFFFTNGEKTFTNNCIKLKIDDNNFMEFINNRKTINDNTNIDLMYSFYQTKEFCIYLKNLFHNDIKYKNDILNSNKFKERYNNNNDLYIHLRLGDLTNPSMKNFLLPFSYYDKAIQNVGFFEKGYISTESPTHEICVDLIKKYKLTLINYDEVETIMFGSTCKNIVLSHGTFSWLIGFLSFDFSKIYFPKIKAFWHGDIFVFSEWKEIDY